MVNYEQTLDLTVRLGDCLPANLDAGYLVRQRFLPVPSVGSKPTSRLVVTHIIRVGNGASHRYPIHHLRRQALR
jgi:hypothetical protein